VIPLVSADAGAVCTHGVTGLVHRAGDVEALVEHLDALSEDVDRRRQMRRAVLDARPSLTWAAAAERLEACYESARQAAPRAGNLKGESSGSWPIGIDTPRHA
jgi:hypothetical protein